jgi:hypothetical protein
MSTPAGQTTLLPASPLDHLTIFVKYSPGQCVGVEMNKIVDLKEQNLVLLLLERDVLKADVDRLNAIVAKLEEKLASLSLPCHNQGCRYDQCQQVERMRVDHIGRLIEERNEAWKELARLREHGGDRSSIRLPTD